MCPAAQCARTQLCYGPRSAYTKHLSQVLYRESAPNASQDCTGIKKEGMPLPRAPRMMAGPSRTYQCAAVTATARPTIEPVHWYMLPLRC